MSLDKKTVAGAVAVAVAIVIPWMVFGGDLETVHANPAGTYEIPTVDWEPIDCWWDVFCLGFCDC